MALYCLVNLVSYVNIPWCVHRAKTDTKILFCYMSMYMCHTPSQIVEIGERKEHVVSTLEHLCVFACPRVCSNTAGCLSMVAGSKEVEDTDQLTDLFLSLFGRQCSVVSVGHSSLNFAGQPLPSGEERLVILVRDRPQKAFFIKVVDPQERKVIGEKRVNKNFQYDTPGGLVITYLSEHGITCIGFRDKEEKEKFCHQLERAVRWLDERAQKQKEKVMEAGERQMRGRDETDGHAHQ
jgi:hypothetical protein